MTQNPPLPWFALQVKYRHEKAVARALSNKGYDVFLPLYRSRHRGARGFRDVDLPLFDTYLFSRFDAERRLPIVKTPGVISILASGKTLLPVDEHELAAVRTTIESGLTVEPCPYVNVGDSVVVDEGPLRGCVGILQRIKKENRLVLSVNLLRRSVAVEIDRTCLRPLPASAAPTT